MPPPGAGAAATKVAMAATVKRVTLENIFEGLLVVVVRIGKFFLLGDDEVGYSTEKIRKKEARFYRFLGGFICPVSNFIFLSLTPGQIVANR